VQGRDQAFEGGLLRNLMTAMRLFNALGLRHHVRARPEHAVLGAVGSKSVVDQAVPARPAGELHRDCDDTSVLYCTVLENVGIPTAFLDGPGHILMMFDCTTRATRSRCRSTRTCTSCRATGCGSRSRPR
jgi:hypothetical protein